MAAPLPPPPILSHVAGGMASRRRLRANTGKWRVWEGGRLNRQFRKGRQAPVAKAARGSISAPDDNEDNQPHQKGQHDAARDLIKRRSGKKSGADQGACPGGCAQAVAMTRLPDNRKGGKDNSRKGRHGRPSHHHISLSRITVTPAAGRVSGPGAAAGHRFCGRLQGAGLRGPSPETAWCRGHSARGRRPGRGRCRTAGRSSPCQS